MSISLQFSQDRSDSSLKMATILDSFKVSGNTCCSIYGLLVNIATGVIIDRVQVDARRLAIAGI